MINPQISIYWIPEIVTLALLIACSLMDNDRDDALFLGVLGFVGSWALLLVIIAIGFISHSI